MSPYRKTARPGLVMEPARVPVAVALAACPMGADVAARIEAAADAAGTVTVESVLRALSTKEKP